MRFSSQMQILMMGAMVSALGGVSMPPGAPGMVDPILGV
jgi:hypothetical protein